MNCDSDKAAQLMRFGSDITKSSLKSDNSEFTNRLAKNRFNNYHSYRQFTQYFFVLLCLICTTVDAGEFGPVQGHVKAQHQYGRAGDNSLFGALGETSIRTSTLDFRVLADYYVNAWEFVGHYSLTSVYGNGVELQNQLRKQFPDLYVNSQDRQWFDLSHTSNPNNKTMVNHTLDRFYVGYSTDQLVVKFGRQAISWTNGLVFRPMDLFNPFPPDAIDTSYKPGSDMVYGQWLFKNGSDLVGLVIPRRDPKTHDLDSEESSISLKWHYFGTSLQTDYMLAQDYGDIVLGFGVNGPLAEAIWRMDVVPTLLDSGGVKTSLVFNVENAWDWDNMNFSGYIEYFHNGFGESGRNYTLDELAPSLVKRLARGQVFNTGRDYLAFGMRVQMTALLSINPLYMYNLGDRSSSLFIQGNYSITQNLNLDFGASLNIGIHGTEFGGIETSSGSDVYSEPLNQIYARLAYYF